MRILAALSLAVLATGCAAQTNSVQAPVPEKLILTETTAAGLTEYQAKVGSIGHGYFAVTTDGAHWAYWVCSDNTCNDISKQKTKALRDCHVYGGPDCVILMQDHTAVISYQTFPVPLPPLPADAPGSMATAAADARPPAPPAAELAKRGKAGWAVDQLHGCWVWNERPEKKDVVTWSGSCAPDGTATGLGVLEWKEYSRYIGTMKDGRMDGQGKMVNAFGESYEGGHKAGQHDGKGTYLWSDGASYHGSYTAGYPNGTGVLTVGKEIYSGQWKMGCFNDGKRTYRIMNNNVPGCSL